MIEPERLDWNYDLDGLTSEIYHVVLHESLRAVNMDDLFCNGTDGTDGTIV